VGNVIEITVKVKDQASAETAAIAEKIRSEMKAARGGVEGVKVPVEPDMDGFEEEVTTRAHRAKPDAVKVPVKVDDDDFEAEFRKAMDEGEQVSAKASTEMRRSFTAIESGSRSLRAAMADLEPAALEAGEKLEEAGESADRAGRNAEASGGGFSSGAIQMTVMAAAAFTLIPALAAVPAVAGAAAAGVAAMALGLGGVIKALHDYGAAAGGGGESAAQMAATAFSNAVAIKNAEQAIADAKKQAAREAEDSTERIKNAQQGVVDAEQQAANAAQSSADQIASAQRSVADAAYNLEQAEQRLQDAEKSELDAQKALTQAREDAANQLKDLNNSAADSHLAVERATLNVSKAQENLAKVLGSSLSTDDQKKDAALALKEAQQGLIDAQQRSVEASQKADAANKTGVDGMQQVVQAQDAVTKANRGVQDAQHGVAQATQAQTDAQLALVHATQSAAQQQVSSAQAVAKAEQSLADAQRSADRQRQDSMEAVAKAEQNLSDTYKQQQLAAAAAASAGGGAVDKFAQDMAALTPAGRAFVNQLLSMRDGAKQLSDTAQTSMLPGLTQMLRDSGPMLPIFNGAIHDMGGIIGGTAEQFGKLMQSPAFQGQLTQVLKDGAGFAKDLGDGLVGMTSGVMQAASQAGPIVAGIGDGIKTLMTSGIPDFFNGLATNADGIGKAFQGIGQFISNLAGPLGIVSGALLSALAPAIKVLASPDVQQPLTSIATSIGQILIVLSPVITMFAQGLAGALRVVAPMLQSVAKFMQDNHRWVVPLAEGIGIATAAFWGLNAALDANPLVLIAGLIAGLVGAVIYAWEHFAGFRDFVKSLWAEVKRLFMDGVHAVEVALSWFGSLPGKFARWLGDAASAVGHGVSEAVSWFAGLPGRVGSAIAGYFSHLGAEFGGWIGGVVDSVARKGGEVLQWFRDLPGKIVAALGNVGKILWNAGAQLIEGFIDGIGSMFGAVKDKLGDLVDKLTDWKGPPAKDAVLLTRNGQLVIQGFIAGIDDQIPAVKAKLGGLTASLPTLAAGGTAAVDSLRLPGPSRSLPSQPVGGGGVMRLELDWAPGSNHGDELLTWLRRSIRVMAGSGPNSVQQALGQ